MRRVIVRLNEEEVVRPEADPSHQGGKSSVALRWTWDGVRLALHLDGSVSYRRYSRRGWASDGVLLDPQGTDLRGHPAWKLLNNAETFSLFRFKCELRKVLAATKPRTQS